MSDKDDDADDEWFADERRVQPTTTKRSFIKHA